jgi:hypothetical protein
MNGSKHLILKLIFALIFFIIGCFGAYLTYRMKNIVHYGQINFQEGYSPLNLASPVAGAGGGVESSNSGVALGLGVFSGLSFVASAKLFSELK